MKILHIPNYYSPHVGGIEQVCFDIVESLKDQDVYQEIICFNDENNKDDKLDILNDVKIHRCGVQKKIMSQSISFSYKKNLKKVFKDMNPDIVIFHYPNPFVASSLLKILKKYKNTKLVLYWHLDIVKQKKIAWIFNSQNKKLLKRSIKVIATSPDYILGSRWLTSIKDKTIVIPNCMREERFIINDSIKDRILKIKEEYKDKIIIFTYGRHVPYKGYKYLIEAAKYLNDDFVILIGGKGELTDQLKEMAKDDHKIKFLGRIEDEDIISYLGAADIFSFPSITKNEAFGIALAEAMSQGLPTVTFKIEGSGVNYVGLKDVTTLEVENANSKAYADALIRLKEDKELREKLGNNAKDRVLDLFTFNKFKEHIINLINDIK